MAKARARLPASLDNMLRSDWERVIYESALGQEDTKIATMYLLDAIPQIDIAIELGLERSTVSRRIPKILSKIEKTAHKLNIC